MFIRGFTRIYRYLYRYRDVDICIDKYKDIYRDIGTDIDKYKIRMDIKIYFI